MIFGFFFLPLQPLICFQAMDYIIPLNGWAVSERKEFRWEAGTEFFQQFDNQEFLSAATVIAAVAVRTADSIDADLDVRGTVKVKCDRCLGELELPVEAHPRLSIRLSGDAALGAAEDGDREVVFPEASDSGFDLRQVIYDYVCLSLPLQKVHPEGECDPETVRFLGQGVENEEAAKNSPFAALKGLFKDK